MDDDVAATTCGEPGLKEAQEIASDEMRYHEMPPAAGSEGSERYVCADCEENQVNADRWALCSDFAWAKVSHREA